MITQCYFIRHAHVAYRNEIGERYSAGEFKKHLTPLGWAQALELDYLLAKNNVQFTKIFSSDLARAIETITPYSIRYKQQIEEHKLLREVEVNGDVSEFERQVKINPDFKFEGGESWTEAGERASQVVFDELSKGLDGVVFVTHGILIEVFLNKHFGVCFETTWPDVIAVTWDSGLGKPTTFERVQRLIPHNTSDHSKISYYPELV
jgi:broad specificity phosphatase PhoE